MDHNIDAAQLISQTTSQTPRVSKGQDPEKTQGGLPAVRGDLYSADLQGDAQYHPE